MKQFLKCSAFPSLRDSHLTRVPSARSLVATAQCGGFRAWVVGEQVTESNGWLCMFVVGGPRCRHGCRQKLSTHTDM